MVMAKLQPAQRRYPVGIQTFSKIIEDNYIYVDKTEYVYNLAHGNAQYVFLSRPRRFGKSLLSSTMHEYFAGNKELFKGLKAYELETEWTKHPVLHFDMSGAKHVNVEALEDYLADELSDNEAKFGYQSEKQGTNLRLKDLILRAYEQTGEKVVIIIDEYDAPLLDVVHESENLPKLRNIMRNFYSPLKKCDPYLRFVFLTGITKFSQMSIFSELNNLKNISMLPEYAGICGITKEELLGYMKPDIEMLAQKMGKTYDETVDMLTKRYDGYHFSWPSDDIFNPFSLVRAFDAGNVDSYWFESGTPTYLIEMLKKFEVTPSTLNTSTAAKTEFDAPTENLTYITPLLYQSGYITIKGKTDFDLYTLEIPNQEVREGLMRSLLPYYVTPKHSSDGVVMVHYLSHELANDNIDGALKRIQTYLKTIPYCNNADSEGHYQQLLFVIFNMLGWNVDIEVRTNKGRVDMVLQTKKFLYIIELKMNMSAEAAMEQIDLKDYDSRFALSTLPRVNVGINFNGETHTLEDWIIEEVKGTE